MIVMPWIGFFIIVLSINSFWQLTVLLLRLCYDIPHKILDSSLLLVKCSDMTCKNYPFYSMTEPCLPMHVKTDRLFSWHCSFKEFLHAVLKVLKEMTFHRTMITNSVRNSISVPNFYSHLWIIRLFYLNHMNNITLMKIVWRNFSYIR
jgi:hypothetical protein